MSRIIIHIDLDFFYGQVEQAANPSLISLPFAIQQKHIVVTCNYLARAAGVKKLQLLHEAKRCCPRLVIVNGEDIQRYRDAAKAVFRHVRQLVGVNVQRLGMDELWLDVTEHVRRHYETRSSALEQDDDVLSQSRETFVLGDTAKFSYNPLQFSGHLIGIPETDREHKLLQIASHLCAYLRESIRSQFSFTSSGGVSTSKLLAKLVGDQHKPNDQTTLLPTHHQEYLDGVEVKKIAGVGYKILSVLFEHLPEMSKPDRRSVEVTFEVDSAEQGYSASAEVLDEESLVEALDDGEDFKLVSKRKEELLSMNKRPLTVLEVRTRVDPEQLVLWFGKEQGSWLWDILHTKDESEVVPSELYPKSIGVEDSFLHCTTMAGVREHLIDLTTDLVHRIENDLTETGKFVRFPSILRLTPRFRGDQDKGELWRHKRTSKSVSFPVDALSVEIPASRRVENLVDKILLPLFSKIAECRGAWDLSLINVGVADFKLSAPSTGISEYLQSPSREVGKKRKRTLSGGTLGLCPPGIDKEFWHALDEQSRHELLANEHNVVKQLFREQDTLPTSHDLEETVEEDEKTTLQITGSQANEESWPEEEEVGYLCSKCSSVIPEFAMDNHICIP